ncbi:hypothetical protein ABZ943_00505 [Streptomyces rubiginosohelvolus]|uniref:hypothetical protein n=1 Tax=Streptomyces rubiginosohelvolus TaxID=67362 RepID=UPI0033EF16DE
MHGVAGPGVVEERAELRALKGVEAAGGARVFLEDDRVLDAGLGQDGFCRAVDCWSVETRL